MAGAIVTSVTPGEFFAIEKLPLEILAKILGYLDYVQQVQLRRVNTIWHHLLLSNPIIQIMKLDLGNILQTGLETGSCQVEHILSRAFNEKTKTLIVNGPLHDYPYEFTGSFLHSNLLISNRKVHPKFCLVLSGLSISLSTLRNIIKVGTWRILMKKVEIKVAGIRVTVVENEMIECRGKDSEKEDLVWERIESNSFPVSRRAMRIIEEHLAKNKVLRSSPYREQLEYGIQCCELKKLKLEENGQRFEHPDFDLSTLRKSSLNFIFNFLCKR